MSERMRSRASDALYTLRTLVERGWQVQHRQRNAICTVAVYAPKVPPLYFDAGTLDDALLKIRLEDFPARAA